MLNIPILALACAVTAASWAMTGALRRRALARGRLDMPNRRSSHAVPTPRGGGLAIVLAAYAAFLVLFLLGRLPGSLLLALLGGVPVAAIGFRDDHKPVSARVRLTVHFAAASWSLAWLGGVPALQIGGSMVSLGVPGVLFGAVAIVWTINLFNFMDGIDGIASAEAIFVLGAAAGLSLWSGSSSPLVPAELLLAAACAGFLYWNWPPARIFMGDVGSGYLGYTIAVFALAAGRHRPEAPFVWLTLGAVFFVDATVTLARRALRGERVHEAHRSHGYQWLARRWDSHLRATAAVTIMNFAWLLPVAYLETKEAREAGWLTAVTLAALTLVALWAGSGRGESRLDSRDPA
ncbi:MAG TPA: glycosyltransferase family 4 protein [Steroidobacteraceae bacterium]|nr:glycosyltransferase family 4 protein [Steroidobacteraceae bacterium]